MRGRSPSCRRRGHANSGSSDGERPHAAPGRAGPRLRAARRLERDLGQARAARRRASGSGSGSQPYLTERMLHSPRRSRRSAAIAVLHRERLDGSGYPRGLSGAAISRPARVLGAADAYQAMREPRPHRPARPADERPPSCAPRQGRPARRRCGRGRPGRRRPSGPAAPRGPAGLTAREVEVLRLVARGLSNKEIARAARDLAQDGRQPRRAHLREDRRVATGPRRACSRCSTACSRKRSCRRRRA